jgi:hypothetical protein
MNIPFILSHYDGFGHVVRETDQYFLICMDSFYNRNGGNAGVNELLYETSKRARGKIVVFLFQDGANSDLAQPLIQIIIKQLDLTEDSCVVVNYGPASIPNATVVDIESWRIWEKQIIPHIQHLPLAVPDFNKKFAALFARFDIYRLKLFRHLYDKYSDSSLLAFNTSFYNYSHKFQQEFSDDEQWCKNHLPVNLDLAQDEVRVSGHVPYQKSLEGIGDLYQQYFIEIVVETDPHSKLFFTEKTMKNFWLGKPFILFSGAGSLAYLRSRGYQTFSPYINEQYDEIENDYLRLEMIKLEIDRLACMSMDELKKLYSDMRHIFIHNRNQTIKNLEQYSGTITKII